MKLSDLNYRLKWAEAKNVIYTHKDGYKVLMDMEYEGTM